MTDKDVNASIEYILAQGLVKPPKFRERISKMFRIIGWKFIFWDLSYSLIFTSVTLLGITYLANYAPSNFQYSVAFGISPTLFLFIMLFAEMNERTCKLYELKLTCHYTSWQIAALRIMCYSLAGAVFSIIVATFCTTNITQFFRMLPLCFGGLLLCAATELSVVRLTRNKWAIAIFTIVWLLINLALPFTFRNDWELFLSEIPLIFIIAFVIVCAAVFMYQTNKMLTEENHYAVA